MLCNFTVVNLLLLMKYIFVENFKPSLVREETEKNELITKQKYSLN